MINLYVLGMKGLIALSAIQDDFLNLLNLVIIGTDKNVKNDYSIQIEEECKKYCIPHIISNKSNISKSKYSIAIGWRWLINDDNLLIVFHDSLLPRYRGFNPLVTALINGDNEVGVSVLKGTDSFDEGGIAFQSKIEICYPIKIYEAIKKVSLLYADLLNQTMNSIFEDSLEFVPQDDQLVSYSLWRDENDYYIDWSLKAEEVKRFIDAIGYPYKGAKCKLNDNEIYIKDAEVIPDVKVENRQPGKVLFKNDTGHTIVCGKGLLRVKDFFDENDNKLEINRFRLKFT